MLKFVLAVIGAVGAGAAVRADDCAGKWLPAAPGTQSFDGELAAMTVFDGGFFVAGNFRASPAGSNRGVALWNGANWTAISTPTGPFPTCDLQGFGDKLFLGVRSFLGPLGYTWNGASWSVAFQDLPISAAFPKSANALDIYQGKLVAAGTLRLNSSSSSNGVWLWDGSQWTSLGGVFSGLNPITATAVFQGDLYVGGHSVYLGGTSNGEIFRYDGQQWSKIGPFGLGPGIGLAMRVYQGKLIIASSDVKTGGGGSYGPLATWDGISLGRIPVPTYVTSIDALTEYNGDLIIGGNFIDSFGVGANCIVRWNGTNFAPLGVGIAGTSTSGRRVTTLETYRGELIVGGDFDTAGGVASPYFARWTDNPTPWVAIAPVSKPVNQGLTLTLTAAAASGYSNVTYKWQRNGTDVADGAGGASPGGGNVSGASGALASPNDGSSVTLTISNVQASDAGAYKVVFDNTCNAGTSAAANVSVNTCLGDLNADGFINDTDFTIFAAAYDLLLCDAPGMPVGCLSDWNGDGVVDDADFQEFVVAYGQVACE
ncbi:MAG: immunoglobulin domain-containing protein [Phycisphaeraceae bacterium]|nr:immunoglobulin domain-containing protein [Phycisphaeraceae bacterium]